MWLGYRKGAYPVDCPLPRQSVGAGTDRPAAAIPPGDSLHIAPGQRPVAPREIERLRKYPSDSTQTRLARGLVAVGLDDPSRRVYRWSGIRPQNLVKAFRHGRRILRPLSVRGLPLDGSGAPATGPRNALICRANGSLVVNDLGGPGESR